MLVDLAAGWLADDAVVVVERATRGGALDVAGGLRGRLRSRRYGEATLWYGRAAARRPTGEPAVEESTA